jgi:hypothetical protein
MQSLTHNLTKAVEKVGEVIGTAIDGTEQVATSTFAALVDSFASVSSFALKKDEKPKAKKDEKSKDSKKRKFTSQLPSKEFEQSFGAVYDDGPEFERFAAVDEAGAAAAAPLTEDEQAAKVAREMAFRKAAAEAEKLNWMGRSWEHRRRETWSGQAERDLTGGGPVTYQQAILAQPVPVLSPLRGSNSPQGVRAIVDASVGTTTTSFNPALGTPGVAIPSNATAGSLDASIKVNVNKANGPVASSFAAMFD